MLSIQLVIYNSYKSFLFLSMIICQLIDFIHFSISALLDLSCSLIAILYNHYKQDLQHNTSSYMYLHCCNYYYLTSVADLPNPKFRMQDTFPDTLLLSDISYIHASLSTHFMVDGLDNMTTFMNNKAILKATIFLDIKSHAISQTAYAGYQGNS